ncbi:MAG: MerC family mercury resistance protein [Flavobacteriaceae bacterium]|nr:MAG: MerC family mercury resistance protein [Flavobacteriaceae bacterium]
MKLTLNSPDTFGTLASVLCVVHCLATPLLFLVHSCSISHCKTTPVWWKSLDYFFLTISFFAIYRSAQTTSKNFMKYALWTSWAILFILIINEKMQWASITEIATYCTAFTLAGLHIYNLNYCQCKTDNCCTKNE